MGVPFRISWVDRIFDWVERIRIGPLGFYLILFAVSFGFGFGFKAPNYPEIPGWLLTLIGPIIMAASHWLRGVAGRAADRIRPALALDDDGAAALRHRLMYAPARMSWIILGVIALYLPIYLYSPTEPFGYRELHWGWLYPGLVPWVIGESMGTVFVALTMRRIYFISRISRSLSAVELFRQQPLHAFAALTMRTAVVLLVFFGYVPLLSLGTKAFTDPFYLGSLVAGAVLACVVAVAPLTGMHRVVAEEKRRRATANGARLEAAVVGLAGAAERADTAAIEAGQKALAALITERDLVAKAPTWPWAPGTMRTLATTVLLPIALLVMGRVLDRVLG